MKHDELTEPVDDRPFAAYRCNSKTSRRRALLSILGGVSALVSCTSPPKANQKTDRLEEQLLRDLKRLGARMYSDEGIPVFLVCENLASSPGSRSGRPAHASNAALAATFRRYAEVLLRVRPEVKEEDVPKLIEVLAERDFGVPRSERGK